MTETYPKFENQKVEDSCSVCYEDLQSVLDCHVVCGGCVKKHFKQECPVCRKRHVFPISGSPPVPEYDEKDGDTGEEKNKPKSLSQIYAELRKKQKEEEKCVLEDDASDDKDVSDDDSDEYDYDL